MAPAVGAAAGSAGGYSRSSERDEGVAHDRERRRDEDREREEAERGGERLPGAAAP